MYTVFSTAYLITFHSLSLSLNTISPWTQSPQIKKTFQHILLQVSNILAHLRHVLILLVSHWQSLCFGKCWTKCTSCWWAQRWWSLAVLQDPVTDGGECPCKMSSFVVMYDYIISCILPICYHFFKCRPFLCGSHQCENDTALPPCEAKSHCMQMQTVPRRPREQWALSFHKEGNRAAYW